MRGLIRSSLILLWLGVAAPALVAAPSAAQNLLLNPGFESSTPGSPFTVPTDWADFTQGAPTNYYSIATGEQIFPGPDTFTAIEGTRGMGFFAADPPGETESLVFQSFPVAPGDTFVFRGSAFVSTLQPFTAASTRVRLDLRFFDATFSTSQVASSAAIDLNTPTEQWVQRQVTATAPAFATQVLAAIAFIECEGQPTSCQETGAAFWDDMSLTQVPTPTVPLGSPAMWGVLVACLALGGIRATTLRSRPRLDQ